MRSLFLEPDGTSRELNNDPPQASWAPDELGLLFDPRDFFPNDNVHVGNMRKFSASERCCGLPDLLYQLDC